MNVLVIGGLGKTAEPIIHLLVQEKHEITIFDLPTTNIPEWIANSRAKVHFGDICEEYLLKKVMADMDVIIHLAVNIIDKQNDALSFNANVFDTYNVLKCAHELNISKIIMASSAPVDLDVDSKSSEQAKDEEQPCCSTNQDFVYDLTKNLQEHEASIFSKTFNMNIIVLRLGHIVDGQRGTDLNNIRLCDVQYCRGGWVSKYDVARAFARAVECGCAGYNMFNIIGSYQAKEKFDMSNTKKVLNFKCEEQFFDC